MGKYLYDCKQDVVEQEPQQHMYKKEGKATPVKDNGHCPGGD